MLDHNPEKFTKESVKEFDSYNAMRYSNFVIESFKSKNLEQFWETGNARGINPNFTRKIRRLLDVLDIAPDIDGLSVGTGLHPLTGDRQGQWAMTVSRNWRITFYFEDGNAFDVNFEDYHGK